MQEYTQVINNLPPLLSNLLQTVPQQIRAQVAEIRLRAGCPIIVCTHEKQIVIGNSKTNPATDFTVTGELLWETLLCISGRALHSKMEELLMGYITMDTGHRVGVCGTAVTENGVVVAVKNISSLNIRIAKNSYLAPLDIRIEDIFTNEMFGIFIVGPPKSGKTTLLKIIASNLSGNKKNVAIIDTRQEIAPRSQNLLCGCDVLSGFPRHIGITNAIKSLAPDVIICDEVGDEDDCRALKNAVNTGVNVIATAHAPSKKALFSKAATAPLIATGAFTHVVTLGSSKNPGEIKEVSLCR